MKTMESFAENVIGKFIDVAQYKELSESIPDRKLQIIEIIPSNEIKEVRARYAPYLEGIDANPFATTLGDEMIYIGSGSENEGYIYYVDLEFGVFKLHESIAEFLSAIKL